MKGKINKVLVKPNSNRAPYCYLCSQHFVSWQGGYLCRKCGARAETDDIMKTDSMRLEADVAKPVISSKKIARKKQSDLDGTMPKGAMATEDWDARTGQRIF